MPLEDQRLRAACATSSSRNNAHMWCRHCKQDVPAVAPAADGAVQCARCQKSLERPAFAKRVSDAGVGLDAQSQRVSDPLRLLESDDSRGRFEEIRRSIRTAQRHADAAPKMLRFDPPESLVQPTRTDIPSPRTAPPVEPRGKHRPSQWVAWLLALAGAMALGTGLGLMFWSLTQAQPELWDWGLGAALCGQGLMIIGLVQLLASVWGAGRESAVVLRGVQQELRRLGRTTETLVGAKSQSAATFYADLARGASPGLLLSNLKSQVDALAAHVAKE